jgi:Rrf2 family nitric oxide-sensitive transcriptional repressor
MRLAIEPGELLTIASISRAYRISEHHLVKVVHALGRHGFVETVRGHGGGLRLARAASQISIGEVVRRMESDFALAACFRDPKTCRIQTCCELNRIMNESLEAFLGVLDAYRLSDLVKRPHRLQQLLTRHSARRMARTG